MLAKGIVVGLGNVYGCWIIGCVGHDQSIYGPSSRIHNFRGSPGWGLLRAQPAGEVANWILKP